MWTVVVSGPAGKFTRFVTCIVISHLNAMGISSLIKLLHGLGGIFHMPVFRSLTGNDASFEAFHGKYFNNGLSNRLSSIYSFSTVIKVECHMIRMTLVSATDEHQRCWLICFIQDCHF